MYINKYKNFISKKLTTVTCAARVSLFREVEDVAGNSIVFV